MQNKSCIRKQFRSYRRSVTQPEREAYENKIIREIESVLLKKKTWRILTSYIPQDGEPNITSWHRSATRKGSAILLPRITDKRQMSFHPYQTETELEIGKYNILQPKANSEEITKDKIDCFLMPLVSYDSNGNRLGMGGGYYDKYLSDYKKGKRPFLLGIAFSNQLSSQPLPTVKTDIKLNGVVNEHGFLHFDHAK